MFRIASRRFCRLTLAVSAGFILHLPAALADQVVPDDQIVQGSECIGLDCINDEDFGFDTLRLKENNLRIDFEDTSNSGSFPSEDWGIVANDSTNGGANYFMIQDRGVDGSASNSVFRIDAGAGGAIMMGYDATSSGLNTVSFGSSDAERRLTNIAAGIDGTDAVNLNQLNAALATVGTGPLAVTNADVQAGDQASLTSANAHADAGDAATISAARSYTDTQSAQTLTSANAYTDAKVKALNLDYDRFKNDVFDRLDRTDVRLNRSGAMSTAMAQMTASAAGVRTNNRVAVGVGYQGGQNAVSVGFQRSLGNRANMTLGAAFSGSQSTAGVGFSTGW